MKYFIRRTKIICTLGPSTGSLSVIQGLLQEGMNVARFNLAHGTHKQHLTTLGLVKKAAKREKKPVGILFDLPGPKLRLRVLGRGSLVVKRDDEVLLTARLKRRFGKRIFVNYPRLTRDIRPGHAVYLADGLIRMTVKSIVGGDVHCRVTNGGIIRTGNGVNLPQSSLALEAFTKEDEEHLAFGLKNKVDFVAISFVANASDIKKVRQFCSRGGHHPFLIAKIERKQALKNYQDLLDQSDGIMVARGDLGVEVSFSDIPQIQQNLMLEAIQKGKPTIVATQVLESMTQNPRPTRAEATDIANSVREGADAIMLSGETSIGRYPLESVRALAQVMEAAELKSVRSLAEQVPKQLTDSDVMAHEACHIAERLDAKLILVPTRSGGTARRVSRFRPLMPIVAFVKNEGLRRSFTLYHGLKSLPIQSLIKPHTAHKIIRSILQKEKLVKPGDKVLIVSGAPGVPVGQTGMVQVVQI